MYQRLAIGLCTVLLTAACGQAVRHTNARTVSAKQVAAAARSDIAVAGRTTGENELLRRIVDGMDPSDILSVSIVGPPVSAPNIPASSAWLKVTHPGIASTTRAALARGRWEGLVVAGAYLDQCKAAEVPCIQGVELVGPQGREDGDFTAVTHLHHPILGATSASDTRIATRLEAAAQNAGLTNVSISFEDAAGFSVPVLTAKSNDPKGFTSRYHSTTILGNHPPFASLVELHNSTGSVFYVEGLSPATRQGTAWVSPGLHADTLGFNSAQS